MRPQVKATLATYGVLILAGSIPMLLPQRLVLTASAESEASAPNVIYVTGTVRDFSSSHPDFNMNDPADMDHYVSNVANVLGADGKPMFSGGGHMVTTQWKDKNNKPIMPYGDPSAGSDPGLPGGHFDVDVYKQAGTKQIWHKHEFDDAYNTTFIDVANDTKLLFRKTIPLNYPNNLIMEFRNPHHGGGGTYEFQAGGALITGVTFNGFSTTFNPNLLTKLKVNFTSLDQMRGTQPGVSQGDAANRDQAFHIRMRNANNNAIVYEIATYHHIKSGSTSYTGGGPTSAVSATHDVCGAPNNDTLGTFGDDGTGGITDLASFDQWFHDHLGVNSAAGHTIAMTKDASGVYEYCDSNFYPIDNKLGGNEGSAHNNFFTYHISSTFVYKACTGQFFQFQGNDDAWVFINGKLVIDLGGVSTPSMQHVDLDRLGLVDGQTYPLDFFYAHRRETPNSLFCMRTNLQLGTGHNVSVTGAFD